MKTISLSKYKIKNYLTQHMVSNILQAEEDDLFNLIRYDGIKGFEQLDDTELFEVLAKTIPEFELLSCSSIDNNHLLLSVKKEYAKNEDDIMVDVTRISQIKMFI